MLTKLFESNNEEIALSFRSIIFFIYSAFLLPFLILEIILAFEVAVIAVSDPDKNPEININTMIIKSKKKLNISINKLI